MTTPARPPGPTGPRTGRTRRGVQIPDVFADLSGGPARTATDILFGGAPDAATGDAEEVDNDEIVFTLDPTSTIDPARPRTERAGWRRTGRNAAGTVGTIVIQFRTGAAAGGDTAVYEYYDAPYAYWRMMRRNQSTGRVVNRYLNNLRYARVR